MPDFPKYKLQIDTLDNKAMLRTNSGVPVGINQNGNTIFRLMVLRQPKLVAVHMAQVEQRFSHEAAKYQSVESSMPMYCLPPTKPGQELHSL